MSGPSKVFLALLATMGLAASVVISAPPILATLIQWTDSSSTPCASGTDCMWVKTSDHLPYWHKSDNTNTSLISASGGTVSSVALTTPSWITTAGSPITTSGTFALTATNQSANNALMGPTTGSPAASAFRTFVNADLATTNAVLQLDWFVSPVIEMANGLHDGVYASFANHTCGTRFMPSKGIHVTGVTMFCPGSSAKTDKVSLWNKAGTRLANTNISCGSGTSTSTGTFGSSVALTAGLLYYVSGWITDGSLGLGYGVANTDLNITSSQVDVHWPGSAVITWTGWGADASGDVFPNGDNVNVICQFVPAYTVP